MLLLFKIDHLQMFSFCGRDCHQYRSYRYMTYTVLAGRKTLPSAILALTISQAFISSHLFSIPWHNLSFGARAFCVSAPKIWNSSPSSNPKQTVLSFRRHLKTHYFHSAYLSPCGPHNAPDSLLHETVALYKFLTYLLTLLVESAPFFVSSTSFCSLSYWFTSSCMHYLTVCHHIRSHHLSLLRPVSPYWNSQILSSIDFLVPFGLPSLILDRNVFTCSISQPPRYVASSNNKQILTCRSSLRNVGDGGRLAAHCETVI